MSLGRLPLPATEAAPTFELLSGGTVAFERIVRRIDEARRTVMLRCFEWRDDETGNLIGEALLRAADRGVKVTIFKDRVGMCYEHLEASKQSFFHKQVGPEAWLQARFLMVVYGRWGSLHQQPNPLADALLTHANVTVLRDQKRFDHAKLYVIDNEIVILGGMGIGDDFRHTNVDFMVEISGAGAAARLEDRYEGRVTFDPNRSFDYLLHGFQGSGPPATLAADRLALIAGVRKRLTIEMAYLGDRACTEALVAAVERGVQVTLLTAARANVLGDLNLATCAEILRRTGSPANLRIVLHPRMVHGKAMVGDGAWVDLGSTNFTTLSHASYEELDLFLRDAHFAAQVEAAIEADIRAGTPAQLPLRYRRLYAAVERIAMAIHGRH
jgi:phosphatidylserine/phosphatidylglycerophosphate/cardiolipin synthase-like enzyme